MIERIDWSSWLTSGTPPQWLLLAVLVIALLRYGPVWHKQMLDAKAAERGRTVDRVNVLENKLSQLRADCDAETKLLKAEIASLHKEINGLRAQRIQEQISIIRGIIATVDSPELKRQLSLLESVQEALSPQNVIQTQIEDVIQKGDRDAAERT